MNTQKKYFIALILFICSCNQDDNGFIRPSISGCIDIEACNYNIQPACDVCGGCGDGCDGSSRGGGGRSSSCSNSSSNIAYLKLSAQIWYR